MIEYDTRSHWHTVASDDQILSLFRLWIDQRCLVHQINCEDPGWEDELSLVAALEAAIAVIPSAGAAGLVIKALVALHIDGYCPHVDEAAPCYGGMTAALLRDAIRFVPQLGPFCTQCLNAGEHDPALCNGAADDRAGSVRHQPTGVLAGRGRPFQRLRRPIFFEGPAQGELSARP